MYLVEKLISESALNEVRGYGYGRSISPLPITFPMRTLAQHRMAEQGGSDCEP